MSEALRQFSVVYRGTNGIQRAIRVAARSEERAAHVLSLALPPAEVVRVREVEHPDQPATLEERP